MKLTQTTKNLLKKTTFSKSVDERQEDVHKWLRDEYGIYIHMYSVHVSDGKTRLILWGSDLYDMMRGWEGDEEYILYSARVKQDFERSYEEAYEKGIQRALTMIIDGDAEPKTISIPSSR